MATKIAPEAQQALAIGGAVIVGLFVLRFFAKEAGEAAGDAATAVGQAINPVNPENIFARGVNAIGATISGDESFSLGSFLFDVFNDEPDPTVSTETGAVAANPPPS